MADQRPLVLINGNLQQLPVGDDLSTHLAIIQSSGHLEQLPGDTDYSLYSPLVFTGGNVSELPAGDTLLGIPAASSFIIDDFDGPTTILDTGDTTRFELAPAGSFRRDVTSSNRSFRAVWDLTRPITAAEGWILRTRMNCNGYTTTPLAGIGFSTGSGLNGHYFLYDPRRSEVEIRAIAASNQSNTASITGPDFAIEDIWYWYELEMRDVSSTTTLFGRVYADNSGVKGSLLGSTSAVPVSHLGSTLYPAFNAYSAAELTVLELEPYT